MAELAYTPFSGSWLNRIEARFQALRSFTLDSTDRPTRRAETSMIRRDIHRHHTNARNRRLRDLVNRANVA